MIYLIINQSSIKYIMKTKIDHPGVYIPPPLLYVVIFLLSVYIQKLFPLTSLFFKTSIAFILGILFAIIGLILLIPAVVKFFKTKNTLITIKPANSLQTTGIYSITRNPMYLGLLNIYTGIAFFKGNWWTLMLIPIVILTITYLVILKEEKYMARAFGNLYVEYSKNVRRWI